MVAPPAFMSSVSFLAKLRLASFSLTESRVREVGQYHASRDYSVVGKRTGEIDADFVDCCVVVAFHQVCFGIFP